MVAIAQTDQRERIEQRTRAIGHALLDASRSGTPIWDRTWWDDHLMDLTMSDPDTKVQLFRFIDALPALRSAPTVRQHLRDYLHEVKGTLPWPVRLIRDWPPSGSWTDAALARMARVSASRMARRFIAGTTPADALTTILRLRSRHLAFTADLLGEAVISVSEADAYQRACLDLLRKLAGPLAAEPEIPQIDRDESGLIPRVNLSLKMTSLVPRFDPLAAATTSSEVLGRLRPILRTARELGAYVHIDQEQYAYKDLIIHLFQSVLMEPEFRDWPDVGIVVQAYLRESAGDLERLRGWVGQRGTPVTVRLVKGAYWDYEVLSARQIGWPVPVFEQKWETDASYEECSDLLLTHRERLRPTFGTHNARSIAHVLAEAEARDVPKSALEIQMLYGMGGPIERELVRRGLRVRVYTPWGELLPGMAYLVRRLLENTSNESFLKASAQSGIAEDDLLRSPEETGAMWVRTRPKVHAVVNHAVSLGPFRNEPPTDFSKPEKQRTMQAAIDRTRKQIEAAPFRVAPIVGGERVESGHRIDMRDPGASERTVSHVYQGDAGLADRAVAAARAAFPEWSATPARQRADILLRDAEILRRDRFALSAIEMFECGKPWREADADIAEAIDFCEYYAREMIRLAEPERRDVPGETNAIEPIARGVVVVIPPWNFPLAIPTGMTVAALVTGNTVILKPAEQSPVIAWRLAESLYEAGLPRNALQYLPGSGEEVGQALVHHPQVDMIAFTGSREVGLLINHEASEPRPGQDHVKRVIAEMGGKNAIIIDEDADLDEAVVGVLQSAFGYAGQKCSACSRAIVLEDVYDHFLSRLVDAARALKVGPAEDPETVVGPLIDTEALGRVQEYARLAGTEGRVVLKGEVDALSERGNYFGPMIVADVSPEARIAREEIFGPLLAILRTHDLDEALRIAHGTDYALTGGLYSRSPSRIERVKREYRVGNLYINRPITGALVDRQSFGGFKLSGIGTKAGGPDYLREFLLTRVVTENTMRRGFAPTDAEEGT